jgi:exosortase K
MFIDNEISRIGAPAERNLVREDSAPPERILSSMGDFYRLFVPTGRELSHFSTNSKAKHLAQLTVILFCGAGLKYFYSTASVNQLRWILAPTTALVELISGQRFQFESYAGYINTEHSFLIAASCAGVNFLITAFLMLALGHLWRNRSQSLSWKFIPYAGLIAYLATLLANTVRITTALQLRAMRIESGLFSPGQLHRFEGIFVYFGFLLLLYVVSDFLCNATPPASDEAGLERKRLACNTWARALGMQPGTVALQSLNARAHQRRPVTFQRCLFPLAIYYGTTLGVPFLNGAFHQADFWEHSLWVLLIPMVFVIPFAGFLFARKIWSSGFTFVNGVRAPTLVGHSLPLNESPTKVGTLTRSNSEALIARANEHS